MSKNVWLYIGTASRTLMIPASKLRGMHPAADGTLLLSFNSIVNTINTPPDKVILNLFADNTHLDVIKAISRAIHNQTPTFGGFVTLADDTTTAFHQPEYLTDRDGTEAGKIASVNSLIIQDASSGALTATTAAAWANGTETPRAGVWTVTSDSAAKVVHLPPCHQGARVEYLCSGSGFKLRAEVTSDYINGVTGEVEEVCPAGISRVRAYGMTTTTWMIEKISTAGEDIEISGITTTGEDIDLTANSASINLTATEDTAQAIFLNATTGGIQIQALDAGASASDINVVSAGGSVVVQSGESAADSLVINSIAGGIDITATGAAAGEDIDIIATGSSVNITSTESASDAINITTTADNNVIRLGTSGIRIASDDDIQIDGLSGSITNFHDQLKQQLTITDSSITGIIATEYIINDANGGTFDLPAAGLGKRISIVIGTLLVGDLTIRAMGGATFTGYAILEATDAANNKTLFQPGGSDDECVLNGSTRGGLVGDRIEMVCISATEWRIRAILSHTGAAATPFET